MEGQPIAVHEVADIFFPQENVREAWVVRDEKTESLPVSLESSLNNFSLGRKAVAAPVKFYELPFLDQRPEGLAEFSAPVGRNVQPLSHLGQSGRLSFVAFYEC
jgi:hypothetical protein